MSLYFNTVQLMVFIGYPGLSFYFYGSYAIGANIGGGAPNAGGGILPN
jgi:hypothetical protein